MINFVKVVSDASKQAILPASSIPYRIVSVWALVTAGPIVGTDESLVVGLQLSTEGEGMVVVEDYTAIARHASETVTCSVCGFVGANNHTASTQEAILQKITFPLPEHAWVRPGMTAVVQLSAAGAADDFAAEVVVQVWTDDE